MSARDVIDLTLMGRGYDRTEGTADAILSALTAAGYTLEQGWQDIATAPRDGTRILCFAPPSTSEYPDPVWKVDKWRNNAWWEMRPAQPYAAWRPLPAPPAQEPQP
jgi:hypothetical protein